MVFHKLDWINIQLYKYQLFGANYRVLGLWLIRTTWLLEVDAKLVIGLFMDLYGSLWRLFVLIASFIWWGPNELIWFDEKPSPWAVYHTGAQVPIFSGAVNLFVCFPEIWPIEMTWNLATWQNLMLAPMSRAILVDSQHALEVWTTWCDHQGMASWGVWTSAWDFGGSWNVMDPMSFSVQSF